MIIGLILIVLGIAFFIYAPVWISLGLIIIGIISACND